MQTLRNIIFLTISLMGFIFANCPNGEDVCLSLSGSSLTMKVVQILRGSNLIMMGVQLELGDAVANGFTVSATSSTVLAFSFTGA